MGDLKKFGIVASFVILFFILLELTLSVRNPIWEVDRQIIIKELIVILSVTVAIFLVYKYVLPWQNRRLTKVLLKEIKGFSKDENCLKMNVRDGISLKFILDNEIGLRYRLIVECDGNNDEVLTNLNYNKSDTNGSKTTYSKRISERKIGDYVYTITQEIVKLKNL